MSLRGRGDARRAKRAAEAFAVEAAWMGRIGRAEQALWAARSENARLKRENDAFRAPLDADEEGIVFLCTRPEQSMRVVALYPHRARVANISDHYELVGRDYGSFRPREQMFRAIEKVWRSGDGNTVLWWDWEPCR